VPRRERVGIEIGRGRSLVEAVDRSAPEGESLPVTHQRLRGGSGRRRDELSVEIAQRLSIAGVVRLADLLDELDEAILGRRRMCRRRSGGTAGGEKQQDDGRGSAHGGEDSAEGPVRPGGQVCGRFRSANGRQARWTGAARRFDQRPRPRSSRDRVLLAKTVFPLRSVTSNRASSVGAKDTT